MRDIVNEWLSDEKNISRREGKLGIWRKPFICNDGFEISIQASRLHYCNPSSSKLGIIFDYVEVRCEPQNEFSPFIDDEDENFTTYGYVPVDVVNKVIQRHNGSDINKFALERERNRTKEERFRDLEHEINYIFHEKDNVTLEDFYDLSDIKQAIIIFLAKDEYGEKNDIFLSNTINEFYKSMSSIKNRHSDISFFHTRTFMEDFYFKKEVKKKNKEDK